MSAKKDPKNTKTELNVASDGVGDGVNGGGSVTIKLDEERLYKLIDFCKDERARTEMMDFCGIHSERYFRTYILNPLLKIGILKRTVPDKPNSPKQKYVKNEIS